jgi:hypothetical protein
MLASGRLSASTVPAYCRSTNRSESHRQPCPAVPAVLVSPSPTPIPRRKATGRRLDPTSSNLTPRPNPHRARGTDGAPTSRDFVPWRFSDAGRPSMWRLRHCRRPKTCTITGSGFPLLVTPGGGLNSRVSNFLVADADVALMVKRHRVVSFPRVITRTRHLLTNRVRNLRG